ncbi:DMT family transporter [Cohaesibacter sp. ES.047]|uniref:DMT family transporter n=1 Tax=Cohaesibacter sp. ES.047 TaxID=1798205 RepID=UPI0018D58A4F|nr:DMT family transporter [Cohaesibacter sp. ES.047]
MKQGLGALSITCAVLLLSLSDALVKLNNQSFALGQLLLIRSLVAMGLLMALLLACQTFQSGFSIRAFLVAHKRPWLWARSMCLALMWGCYYASLPFLSFSLAAACYYTAPVWMAILSSVLLGRRMRGREILAIILGLCGVMTILRPGLENVSIAAILPLLAGFLYALAAIITSRHLKQVPALVVAINLNLVIASTAAVSVAGLMYFGPEHQASFLLSAWSSVDWNGGLLLIGLGGLLAIITFLVAVAYQSSPAPIIGLFDNGYLAFAILWGILLFEDWPDLIACLGVMLIGAGALLASARQ